MLVLLYVLHSTGSSPGRQGFKMAVSSSGTLLGSIGGGIMEYKLVEWCRTSLIGKPFQPFIRRQIHQGDISQDRSGMICSGEQTIAFYSLGKAQRSLVVSIVGAEQSGQYGLIQFTETGLLFTPGEHRPTRYQGSVNNQGGWLLEEDIGWYPTLHIMGGGHVSLALSHLAHQLAFRVKVYDDRDGLNTMTSNTFAECIQIPSFESISGLFSHPEQSYVVLMSFGYRTDKLILQQILHQSFYYLGMMGSQAKVKQLLEELQAEGFTPKQLSRLYAPIGLPIASQTPAEIAVSIMAQIIQIKNQSSPQNAALR